MSFRAATLLKLPAATLEVHDRSYSGPLELQSVTVTVGEGEKASDAQSNPDIYLVLRMSGNDTPIDPSTPIQTASNYDGISYTFGTADGRTATLLLPIPSQNDKQVIEDQDTFHEILAQYSDFQDSTQVQVGQGQAETVSRESAGGRVFFVDESSGQVVGELDHKFQIKEDPALGLHHAENDLVVIEIVDENAGEAFARVIPPEERDWLTNSAALVSRAISGTTRLILTSITSASDYYIGRSKPYSPVPSANDYSGPTSQRLHAFFTSESTHKGLSTVHSLSTQAATVSSETVALIQTMVRRIVRGKRKPTPVPTPAPLGPPSAHTSANSLKPPLPPRTPSSSFPQKGNSGEFTKPPLPPRQDPPPKYSRTPSPQPPIAGASTPTESPVPPPLGMSKRLLLSVDMILSTMDSSAKQIVSVSGDSLTRVVEHKYGPEAARSAGLVAGTSKNIVAVYMDVSHVGRRAIIKMVGREYVVAKTSSRVR
ncbi:hypothetical protein EDD16DRAFT_1567558 [Pisolithus croceorrhizus]|nr:hypothetical protein EDD16DRAFT_1567558 [Pisolithus croceorrhizus]KAI6125294.1 hypothetical protein EV401DRAFT_1938952 [Pisolithus croceorrhizus]